MRKLLLIACALLFAGTVVAGEKLKHIAYASANSFRGKNGTIQDLSWAVNPYTHYGYDSVSLSSVDILVLFSNWNTENLSQTAPYFDQLTAGDSVQAFCGENGNYPGTTDSIIAVMHRMGKKVLISVVDIPAQDLPTIGADSTLCENVAMAIAGIAYRHNFDGMDLNVETNVAASSMYRFVRILRRRFNDLYGAGPTSRLTSATGRAIFTVAPGPGQIDSYPAAMDSCIDYYMPQYYAYHTAYSSCGGDAARAWGGPGYSRGGFPSCFEGQNLLQDGPQVWVARGLTASKMIIGVASMVYTFSTTDTIGGGLAGSYGDQSETSWWYMRDYQAGWGGGGINGFGTEQFSGFLKLYYRSCPALTANNPLDGWSGPGGTIGQKQLIIYPGDSTAYYYAKFVDSMGFGGVMTFAFDKTTNRAKALGSGRNYFEERLQIHLSRYDTPYRNGIFLHHSTGGLIWSQGGATTSVPAEIVKYNTNHSLRVTADTVHLNEVYWPYYPSGGENEWVLWDRIFKNTPYNAPDTLGFAPGGNGLIDTNKIIVIKTCFPASSITGTGSASDTTGGYPDTRSIYAYKTWWRNIIHKMAQYDTTFWCIWNGIPQETSTAVTAEALRALAFATWAKDTLAQGLDATFGTFPPNVYVFDSFRRLATADGKMDDAYRTAAGNSHPNAAATDLLAPLFVNELFNAAINYELGAPAEVPPAEPAPPDAPVATAGTSVTTSGFTANWNASSGATGYRLDVSISNSFSSYVSGWQDKTVAGTSDAISGLSASTPYYYRVRAVNGDGTSGNSNTITVTTSTPPAGRFRMANRHKHY